MSANNYMLIEETKPNHFAVSMRDADTGDILGKVKHIYNLPDAISVAQEEETEYRAD